MSLVNDLDTEVENFKREYEKFERGNKSAGTRARKVLQDIKKTCQEIRVSIQGAKKEEEKSSLPPANWQVCAFNRTINRFFCVFLVKYAKKRLTYARYEGIFPFGFWFVYLANEKV